MKKRMNTTFGKQLFSLTLLTGQPGKRKKVNKIKLNESHDIRLISSYTSVCIHCSDGASNWACAAKGGGVCSIKHTSVMGRPSKGGRGL